MEETKETLVAPGTVSYSSGCCRAPTGSVPMRGRESVAGLLTSDPGMMELLDAGPRPPRERLAPSTPQQRVLVEESGHISSSCYWKAVL